MTLEAPQQTQRAAAPAPGPGPSIRRPRLRRRAVWLGMGAVTLAILAGGAMWRGATCQPPRAAFAPRWPACPKIATPSSGLSNALFMQGDEKTAVPLRERVRKLELLNSLVQRAANPAERGKPELMRELGAACAALGRDGGARAWFKLAIASDPLDTISQQSLFQIDARLKPRPEPPGAPRG